MLPSRLLTTSHIVSMLLMPFLTVSNSQQAKPYLGAPTGGIMEFDSLPVVSLLVLWVSGLTVQVAHMPLKVLASAAFGKKWPWPVQPRAHSPHPLRLTAAQWQVSASTPRGMLPSSRRWRWLPPPPPNQPAHWKLIPTNKLLSTRQRGAESVSRMDWQKKKKEEERCVGKSTRGVQTSQD